MKLVFDIVKNGKNIPQKRNYHFEEEGGLIGRNETCFFYRFIGLAGIKSEGEFR